ncbi:FxSxx-COOH system tetratricopeptide repeat protein [Streptomyces sp. NPDC101175]|uniref:FxSxx-COOH system tetratricopeptide repeat protein n=1 Tax=Streptomyces sp. NPDC101175 TaxID=3366123 RepID=UPI0038384667
MSTTSRRQTRVITFYAAQTGTGRSMALANIAWILASNGKSVLVVDWDLENPGLHLYYARYLTDPDLRTGEGILDMFADFATASAAGQRPAGDPWAPDSDHASFGNYDVGLNRRFPGDGRLSYLSPGHVDGDDYAARRDAVDWTRLHGAEGQAFLATLRHRMSTSEYDYILIDGRSGSAPGSEVCTLALPDTVVLCVNLNRQSVEGARRMAQLVRGHIRPIDLHVLPLRVENTTGTADVERAVRNARSVLDPYLDLTEEKLEAYWQDVRLPYQPELAFGEKLAVMAPGPMLPHTLLYACVRAAARITDGAVNSFDMPPREEREDYHAYQTHVEQQVVPLTVALLNHPDDQLWANWVVEQLTAAGVKVQSESVLLSDDPAGDHEEQEPDTDYVIALLSTRLEQTSVGDRIAALAAPEPTGSRKWHPHRPRRIGLRVSTAPLPPHFDWPEAVNLAGQREYTAHRALFSGFAGEIGTPPFAPAERTRFPGGLPRVHNLPMRNAHFEGRSRQLAELHAAFAFSTGEHTAPQVLWGGLGVGKHQTALEYAHRYASQYDLVWLIPATSEESIRTALRELAEKLNTTLSGTQLGQSLSQLLDEVRTGRYYSRSLLVFDGADNSAAVEPFLPTTGPGHILITSRSGDWPDAYQVRRLDVFTPEESLRLLEERICGADRDALARLADRLGHLPLMLNGAATELRTAPSRVDAFIALLNTLEANARDEVLPAYRIVDALYQGFYWGLKRNFPAAARLLELCSFLSPDGVSMVTVVESTEMRNLLARLDPGLRDELRLRAVVNQLAVTTLAFVDQSTERLTIPRVIQDLVHGWIPAEERDGTRREILSVLASLVPSDLKRHRKQHRATFSELDRHLEPSGALDSTDQDVRRWLVSQVYHRRVDGRWDEALDLGARLLERWSAEPDGPSVELLRLESEMAGANRELGRYAEALELSTHAYETLRARDPRDVYTLLAARGHASALRATGQFQEAFRLEQSTHQGLVQAVSKEYNATLDAASNLALSKFYVQTVEAALALARDTHTIRLRQLGADDFRPWISYAHLGTYCRELGDLESSEPYLRRAYERLSELTGKDSHLSLDARASLGVTLVRKGEIREGQVQIDSARAGLRRRWGDRYPRAMACELSNAIRMHADGRSRDALATTQEVYGRYVEVFGEDHPFTIICRNNMAVYLLATGDAETALSHLETVVYRLETAFGRGHRYPLAARLNQSNCRNVLGEDTRNEDIGIHDDCRKPTAWGEEHQVTLIALANRLSSEPAESGASRAILAERVSVFPEGHPLRDALLAHARHKAGADLEVQDV